MASLIISLINVVLPNDLIINYLFPISEPEEIATFTEQENNFETSYKNSNPCILSKYVEAE